MPSAWLRHLWQQSPDHGLPLCFPLTRDLTDNQLVTLPLDGLAGLTHLKLQGNPALSEPFSKESFPKMRYLGCWLFPLWCSAEAAFAHSTQPPALLAHLVLSPHLQAHGLRRIHLLLAHLIFNMFHGRAGMCSQATTPTPNTQTHKWKTWSRPSSGLLSMENIPRSSPT